jgi:hypothetical protein
LHPAPDPEHGGRNVGSAKKVAATILKQESGVQELREFRRQIAMAGNKWWCRLDS